MIHPWLLPEACTSRNPLPWNGALGAVDAGRVVVLAEVDGSVGVDGKFLGRYCMPVLGQEDFEPSVIR